MWKQEVWTFSKMSQLELCELTCFLVFAYMWFLLTEPEHKMYYIHIYIQQSWRSDISGRMYGNPDMLKELQSAETTLLLPLLHCILDIFMQHDLEEELWRESNVSLLKTDKNFPLPHTIPASLLHCGFCCFVFHCSVCNTSKLVLKTTQCQRLPNYHSWVDL